MSLGVDQVVIGICGLSSVWLSQDARPRVARFACLFGLAAQPAWFYTTWQAQQWAIFALAFVYSVGWGRGVWNFWLRPLLKHPKGLEP
jgi:hypothetical protein